jgi:hypothetical protein
MTKTNLPTGLIALTLASGMITVTTANSVHAMAQYPLVINKPGKPWRGGIIGGVIHQPGPPPVPHAVPHAVQPPQLRRR